MSVYVDPQIWDDILAERDRQEDLKAAGKFSYTCADHEMTDERKLTIITEEIGEVARVICDVSHHTWDEYYERLREEIIQACAIGVAWIQSIDAITRRNVTT